MISQGLSLFNAHSTWWTAMWAWLTFHTTWTACYSSEAVEKMMLLRGAMARRLCRISLRSYSTAIEMTPHSSEAANSERVMTDNDVRDVTRYMSAREANKSRTRARVEGQLKGFLASKSDDLWDQGPPREAYWLLRACGSDMLLETTATRMELTHSMWEEFENRVPMPVGMYNTLLQVYLQNGHKFDVPEFLENMEKKGVLPNQGTLIGIFCCYCDEGNIEGATRILDQMRSLDMEISENIYAALITGHCRRGDMESAEGMLTMMEENGMLPMTTSYAALMCGFADRGNMDKVEQLLDVMREKRVFPSVTIYAAIMDRLSASGHSDLLPRALDLVHNKQLIYNDLYELACKCTVRYDNKGTLLMLRCMATLVPRTTNIQLGAILIRTMAFQGRSMADITVMATELQSLGFGYHVYEEMLHSLHNRHDNKDQAMSDALTVLQDMQRHDVTLKEHYYYPNLAYYAQKGDVDSAVKCVLLLKEAGLQLRPMAFQYLLQAAKNVGVANSEGGVVSSDDNTTENAMHYLLNHVKGTPLSLDIVNEVTVHLLGKGQFVQVPALLNSTTSDPNVTHTIMGRILKAIKNGINQSMVVDIDGLVAVYVALHSLPNAPQLDRSIAIATNILVEKSRELAKKFIEELNNNGIEPGDNAYHRLVQSYANPDTAKEFHAMVKSMQSRGLVLPPSIHKQMLELAADMGDPIRAGQAVSAIKRSGQQLSATAFSRYIVANAKSRRIGTALELYERMRSHDLRPSYEAMSHLMTELLRWGDIQGAENLRSDLEDMGYSPGLVLRNAFLGSYARRDMTKALHEFESLKASDVTKPNTFTYNELMVGYSLHGDTESIRTLFDELLSEGLTLDRGLISRLFDAHITRGDIDGALSMIDEYSSLPPHISSLVLAMQLAVDRDKSSEVVKMRDIMRRVVGDNTTDNVMFFSLIKANQISQAQQILQNEEFSLNPRNLIGFIVDLKRKRKRDMAYTTLDMLKSKGHHLGDEIGVAWLRAYDILGDLESALSLRDELISSGHSLSEEFNSRLATVTQNHGNTRTKDTV